MNETLMKPEVILNGRFLDQRVTGVQRYARETLRCLDQLVADGAGSWARWTLVLPAGSTARPELQAIGVERFGALGGHAWEQLVLPWRARAGLLLSFGFTGPLVLKRQIVTVHDAAVVRFPQSYHWAFRAGYRALLPRLLKRAPATIAVSQFSADEAVSCFGADPARTTIGAEGWQHLHAHAADDAILDRHGLRGRPFVLAVSSPARNKNFAVIARALAAMGDAAPLCAVAGAIDSNVFKGAEPVRGDRLIRLGYVSDGELRALYAQARCFVMPSYYEGFGIPVIEAMASGCPVIASTAASLREVGGDAARYFDPDDALALVRQLACLMSDDALAARQRAAGLARVERYSWRANARIHLDVVQSVLNPTMPRCHAALNPASRVS